MNPDLLALLCLVAGIAALGIAITVPTAHGPMVWPFLTLGALCSLSGALVAPTVAAGALLCIAGTAALTGALIAFRRSGVFCRLPGIRHRWDRDTLGMFQPSPPTCTRCAYVSPPISMHALGLHPRDRDELAAIARIVTGEAQTA